MNRTNRKKRRVTELDLKVQLENLFPEVEGSILGAIEERVYDEAGISTDVYHLEIAQREPRRARTDYFPQKGFLQKDREIRKDAQALQALVLEVQDEFNRLTTKLANRLRYKISKSKTIRLETRAYPPSDEDEDDD